MLVTGASRGIGLATTSTLVSAGYFVCGLSRNNTPELQQVLADGRGAYMHIDLSEPASVPDVVRAAAKTMPPLFGLVNNAGIGLDGNLATQHLKDLQEVLSVNLLSPMVMAKFVARHLIRARQGRIVNISSVVAATGYSGLAAYAATKSGLEGFTRSLARELGKANVTVNAIRPGFVATDMTSGLDSDQMSTVARRSPLGLARPQDIAAAVEYLLSPAAARVTGTILTVDGGATA